MTTRRTSPLGEAFPPQQVLTKTIAKKRGLQKATEDASGDVVTRPCFLLQSHREGWEWRRGLEAMTGGVRAERTSEGSSSRPPAGLAVAVFTLPMPEWLLLSSFSRRILFAGRCVQAVFGLLLAGVEALVTVVGLLPPVGLRLTFLRSMWYVGAPDRQVERSGCGCAMKVQVSTHFACDTPT